MLCFEVGEALGTGHTCCKLFLLEHHLSDQDALQSLIDQAQRCAQAPASPMRPCLPALIHGDLHPAMQEATAAEEHSSLLLLLCGGLPAACVCSRHQAVAGVDSGALSWQRCAVDLLHPHVTVYRSQPAAGASHGAGDGPLHGMACSLGVVLQVCSTHSMQ